MILDESRAERVTLFAWEIVQQSDRRSSVNSSNYPIDRISTRFEGNVYLPLYLLERARLDPSSADVIHQTAVGYGKQPGTARDRRRLVARQRLQRGYKRLRGQITR